jgi:hypothetical protein
MELRISDNFEDIPENKPVAKLGLTKESIKVVKQHQQPVQQQPVQTIKPSLSGIKSRMVRPQTPAPKPKVSYDDILTNMGMYLENGKLRLIGSKHSQNQSEPSPLKPPITSSPPVTQANPLTKSPRHIQQQPRPLEQQNSYIYQKYFNNQTTEVQGIRRPQTIQEYRDMLISDIIQKYKIKQIKSSKLIMPTSNINFAQGPSGNLNKLFSFSQR